MSWEKGKKNVKKWEKVREEDGMFSSSEESSEPNHLLCASAAIKSYSFLFFLFVFQSQLTWFMSEKLNKVVNRTTFSVRQRQSSPILFSLSFPFPIPTDMVYDWEIEQGKNSSNLVNVLGFVCSGFTIRSGTWWI